MSRFDAKSEAAVVAVRNDPLGALVNHYHRSPTGTQARLRRSHPIHDGAHALFESESALQQAGIDADGDLRVRWALVLHCIAIARGRHARIGARSTGGELARLWEASDARMRQLVDADFPTLCDLMPRIARRLDAAAVTVDWRPLADLLLLEGERSDPTRRQLVAGYLRTRTPGQSLPDESPPDGLVPDSSE